MTILVILLVLAATVAHASRLEILGEYTPGTYVKTSTVCIALEKPRTRLASITVFKADLNGDRDPCNDPNLILTKSNEPTGYARLLPHGDHPRAEYRLVRVDSLLGVLVRRDDGAAYATLLYVLDDERPIVYVVVNVTYRRNWQRYELQLNFISSIWVTSDPGLTRFVKGFGFDGFRFKTSDPLEMASIARSRSELFEIIRMLPGEYTSGYGVLLVTAKPVHTLYMYIDTGRLAYYLGLTSLDARSGIIVSRAHWAHTKLVAFRVINASEPVVPAGTRGYLCAAIVYGRTLDELMSNAEYARERLRVLCGGWA